MASVKYSSAAQEPNARLKYAGETHCYRYGMSHLAFNCPV
jgi:hypothetical protein